MSKILVFVLSITLMTPVAIADKRAGWDVTNVEKIFDKNSPFVGWPVKTNISFKNGKTLSTEKQEIKFVAMLFSEDTIPFIIFSGRECGPCGANTSIYILSPLKGNLNTKKRYLHPGKRHSFEDNSLVEKTRMFYGECVTKNKVNVIWYTHYLGRDKTWQKSVYSLNFNNKNAVKSSHKIDYKHLKKTEMLVKSGLCTEYAGIEKAPDW